MAGCFFLGELEIERKKEERLFFHNEEINGFNKGLELWPQFMNKEPFSIDGYLDDSNRSSSFVVMRQQSEGMNCQDCGNQAKKDCPYFRCRTCCKTRGFPCQTHVRSTWIPAMERRQRLQQNAAIAQQQPEQQHEPQAFRMDQSHRRRREDRIGTSLTNYLPTDTTQGKAYSSLIKRARDEVKEKFGNWDQFFANFETFHRCPSCSGLVHVSKHTRFGGMQFPTEINSPADFQCVRLSPSMEDKDEEYAYQTAVNIGGRVFRGILYDQGLDINPYGESSSRGFGSQPPLLAASSAAASTSSNPPVDTPLMDPSLYPPPLHTFMDDTQFFPPTTKP